jgi:hypothetical protein
MLNAGPFATKKQARREAELIAARLTAHRPICTANPITLLELLERWRVAQLAGGSNSLHTSHAYQRVRSLLLRQKWKSISDLVPAAITAWRRSPTSHRASPRAGAHLRAVLHWAAKTLGQPIRRCVLTALRPKRHCRDRDAPPVSDQQVRDWQGQADRIHPSAGALVHFLSCYGGTPITTARLRVRHLDLKDGYIVLPGKDRGIAVHPLLPATVERFMALIADCWPNHPLFINPDTGGAWSLVGSGSIPQWFRSHLHGRINELRRWRIATWLAAGWTQADIDIFIGQGVRYLPPLRQRDCLARARRLLLSENATSAGPGQMLTSAVTISFRHQAGPFSHPDLPLPTSGRRDGATITEAKG